nr:PREDICTED: uncharacterized protein LOC108208076 isoform X2 [Daucus carota subsp. sativus]
MTIMMAEAVSRSLTSDCTQFASLSLSLNSSSAHAVISNHDLLSEILSYVPCCLTMWMRTLRQPCQAQRKRARRLVEGVCILGSLLVICISPRYLLVLPLHWMCMNLTLIARGGLSSSRGREDFDEDSVLVLEVPGKVIVYNLVDQSWKEVYNFCPADKARGWPCGNFKAIDYNGSLAPASFW